jgi:hypothetical protein
MIDDFHSPLTGVYFRLVAPLPFVELNSDVEGDAGCHHCKNRGRDPRESYWLIRSWLDNYDVKSFLKLNPGQDIAGVMLCDSCHMFLRGTFPEHSPDFYYTSKTPLEHMFARNGFYAVQNPGPTCNIHRIVEIKDEYVLLLGQQIPLSEYFSDEYCFGSIETIKAVRLKEFETGT